MGVAAALRGGTGALLLVCWRRGCPASVLGWDSPKLRDGLLGGVAGGGDLRAKLKPVVRRGWLPLSLFVPFPPLLCWGGGMAAFPSPRHVVLSRELNGAPALASCVAAPSAYRHGAAPTLVPLAPCSTAFTLLREVSYCPAPPGWGWRVLVFGQQSPSGATKLPGAVRGHAPSSLPSAAAGGLGAKA